LPLVKRPKVFLLLVICLLLFGCAFEQGRSLVGSYSQAYSYVDDVPFFPQEEFQCGPAVLASVLNFRGYRVSPEEIAEAIYLSNLKGTLKMDMLQFAKRYERRGGITVSEVRGDLELIRRDISSGYPLIVFVDLGFWNFRKGHYMLIVGYDDSKGGVVTYSGREKDKFISYNRFMRIWERGGYWALRITPG